MSKQMRSAWLAAVMAVFVFGVTPALTARAQEQAQAQQTATPAPVAAPPADTMSPEDMPVTDMAWPTEPGGMSMDHGEKPKTFEGRLLRWLGMWHPAVIHFPIALLLTVALLELAAVARRKPAYAAGNKLLLAIATGGAFLAAPLGWANAGLPAPADSQVLTIHRWLGTVLPFMLLALWLLKRPVDQAAARLGSRAYEATLALAVLLIAVQSYLGGEITHGANHMVF